VTPPRSWERGRVGACVLAVGLLVGLAVVLALAPGGDEPMDALDDVAETAAGVGGAVAAFLCARKHHGRQRRMWAGFGLFALCWTIGQALWTWREVVKGSVVPTPWFSDVWFLLAVPAGITAATAMLPPTLSVLSRARALVDGFLASVVLLLFSWPLILERVFEYDGLDVAGKTTLLAPLLGDAIMLTVAVAASVRVRRVGRGPHIAVVVGVVALIVADGWYAFKTTAGGFDTGPMDVFWIVGFCALATGALVASRRRDDSVAGIEDPSRAPAGIILPAAATVVAAGVTIWQYVATRESDAAVVGLLVCTILLVSASQVIAAVDVHHLALRLTELSSRDSLTGLLNRSGLARVVRAQPARASDAQSCALLFLDLDGFKAVNDVHGHAVGDVVLQVVAHRVAASLRPGDTVARLGGDELVALMPGVGAAEAAKIAARVLDRVRQPIRTDAAALRIGASIGVSALSPGDGDLETRLDDLIAEADSAMYRAKSKGKNQVVGLRPVPLPVE